MRGVVEIWNGDKLILEEPNMLVDGAGELLADIMTVSPSLSGVQDNATSSILDASNYTIQAISFGTGSYYFNNGGRGIDSDKESLINTYSAALPTGAVGIFPFVYIPDKDQFVSTPYYNPDFTATYEGKSLRIDEAKLEQLPTAPNPVMKTLEVNTNTSAVIEGTSVSSVFPGNGQHCNFLPSAIMSAMMEDTVFSGDVSSYYTAASLLGAFPQSSGVPHTFYLTIFYDGPETSDVKSITPVYSVFNSASSMDVSGFVTNVMSSVPDATYNMSSTFSGLCMSAPTEETNQGFPFVEYSLLIGAGDLGSVNAYGGIYHIGLWTIDMNESLRNGNTPPFAFSILNNPRKYRLFCRKGLSKNLCYINNQDNYEDLTLKWRIYFR